MRTLILLKTLIVFGFTNTVLSQCPTFDETDEWYSINDHCGNPQLAVIDCNGNTQTNFSSVLFYTDGSEETLIEVVGDMSYTFNPNSQLWSHILLYDGCGGDLLWGTFSCAPWDLAVWSTGVFQLDLSPSYTVALDLPEGEYLLLFGYLGIPQVQNLIEGCVSVTIGTPFFLEMVDDPALDPIDIITDAVLYPRKIVHPLYGFCVEVEKNKYVSLFNQSLN